MFFEIWTVMYGKTQKNYLYSFFDCYWDVVTVIAFVDSFLKYGAFEFFQIDSWNWVWLFNVYF